MKTLDAMILIECELEKAKEEHPKFNSAHEGYAVILEELEELWDEIKVKQSKRDNIAIKKEAIQVGAMAARFLTDLCDIGD